MRRHALGVMEQHSARRHGRHGWPGRKSGEDRIMRGFGGSLLLDTSRLVLKTKKGSSAAAARKLTYKRKIGIGIESLIEERSTG